MISTKKQTFFSLEYWKEPFWDLVKLRDWNIKVAILLFVLVTVGFVFADFVGFAASYLFP